MTGETPAERSMARYYELKEHGICPRCKQDAPPGRVFHKDCQRATNAAAKRSKKAWGKRKLEEGLCRICGRNPLATQTNCDDCRRRVNERMRLKRGKVCRIKCGLCKQPGHDRRTCRLRYSVSVVPYATARNAQ